MKAGFFVPEKGVMVEVETVDFSRSQGAIACAQMRVLWASGKHRLPSACWCMWDEEDFSFFYLAEGFPSEDLLNAAKVAAVD
jgi:hypothetical protein